MEKKMKIIQNMQQTIKISYYWEEGNIDGTMQAEKTKKYAQTKTFFFLYKK